MIQHMEHDVQTSVPAVSIVVAIYNVADQLEAHGFAAALRNPYYNWKQQIVAVALKFKLYRLLCLIQKLTK